MDPVSVIYAIGTIISLLTGVDQTTGVAIANNKQHKLTVEANHIFQSLLNSTTDSRKILDALVKQDASLAQNLISSSPFGSRFPKLREARDKNHRAIQRENDIIAQKEKDYNKAQNDYNQDMIAANTSGSVIVDLINGAVRKNKYGGSLNKDTSKQDQSKPRVGTSMLG